MTRYIGILSKDDDSAFGLHFPDLPGCVSAGDSEEEAIANAAIALRLWSEDVDDLPRPSTMAELRTREDVREDLSEGGVAILVPLITVGRKLRLNIMLEPSIVAATDEAAKAAGVSRSQFIERTLEEGLASKLGAARVTSKLKSRGKVAKLIGG